MAIPTVAGVGADNSGSTGSVTYTLPSHQADDILLLVCETNVSAGLTTATSGWAHVTNSPRAQGSNVTCINVFWKRAASGSETNPVVDATSNHQAGFAMAVRGCVTVGNPWDFTPVGSGTASGSTMSATGGTTTVANCLVLICSANFNDTATDDYSAISNGSLANLTIQNQAFTSSGNGGGSMVATGEKATAGATGTTTANVTAATATSNLVFALHPPVLQAASGTVAAVSDVSGSAALGLPASGQVDATTTVDGAIYNLLRPVDAQLDIVSDVTGSAGYIVGAGGTAAATSGVSGSAALLAPVSGTVDVVSDSFGSASPQFAASGQVDAVTGVTGSATLLATGTGTVAAVTSVGDTVTLRATASGTVVAVSGVTGAATALKSVGSGAFNGIVDVFGSATLLTEAGGGTIAVVSGVSGSAGIALDITVTAALDARTRSAELDERTWEASL
jgi:hypothetical protein